MNFNKLLKLSIPVAVANAIGGVLLIVQPILISHYFGFDALGTFSLYISWINIGLLFGSGGMFTVLQRLGARYLHRSKHLLALCHQVMDHQATRNLLISTLLVLTISLLLHQEFRSPAWVLVIAMSVPMIFYVRWMTLKCRLVEKVFFPAIMDQPARELVFFGLLASYSQTSLGEHGSSSSICIAALYLASSTACAFGIHAYSRCFGAYISRPTKVAVNSESTHRILKFWKNIAHTSMPSELGIYFLKRIDVVVVGAIVSPGAAGIYFLYSRIAEAPLLVSGAINSAIGPEISKLQKHKNRSIVRSLYIFSCVASGLAAVLLLASVAAISSQGMLDKVFPALESLEILYILIGGYALYLSMGPINTLLLMTGGQRASSTIAVIILPIHVLSTYFFTTAFGAVGAAISFIITINIQRTCEISAYIGRNRTLNKVRTLN